jgi:hypothetical protein
MLPPPDTIRAMTSADELQSLCERGQRELMEMDYLRAEQTLVRAERLAWAAQDWDALARLYMPLQETRRQRRQRCGEGIVCLDLLATGPTDQIDPRHVAENYPHGQLLVTGWATIAPAVGLRKLQAERGLFVETFLAAVYPLREGQVVAIIPLADAKLPQPQENDSRDRLADRLPPHTLLLDPAELPAGARRGTDQTYGQVMDLWERLAAPFLAEADRQSDPLQKMQAYRTAIEVDYACELAHQHLSDVAREMSMVQARGA